MNILTYHGSDYSFKEFSFENMGKAHGLDAGFGLYFSESKADAATYGDNIYECFLQLKDNVSLDEVTFQHHILKAIVDKFETISRKPFYKNDVRERDVTQITRLINDSKSDVEIIKTIVKRCCEYNKDIWQLLKLLSEYGYTHTIDTHTPEQQNVKHYIVYDLDAITILNKTKI